MDELILLLLWQKLIDAHQSTSIQEKTKSNPNPKNRPQDKIDPDPEKNQKAKSKSKKTRIQFPEKLKSKSSISQLLFFRKTSIQSILEKSPFLIRRSEENYSNPRKAKASVLRKP
ncbi:MULTISPECIES: hypothetical protein [Chitinophagaceae]|uniref:hypothetical protein n=1 Tax=Chitinophagaceae TaxID=563835 RepID=UPI000DEFD1B8|nr:MULTISPECIES: hypothetical protein [Chitinophagaceae]RPD50762.1 hypothetical protein DRJ53_07570 [Paracnuella aquatica]